MPYTHANETVISQGVAVKSRVRKIEIDTPCDENGVAAVDLYYVRIEMEKFNAAGKRLPIIAAYGLSGQGVIGLMSEVPLPGETIGAAVSRLCYEYAAAGGQAPAGGSIS